MTGFPYNIAGAHAREDRRRAPARVGYRDDRARELMHFQNILEPMLTNERVCVPNIKWAETAISEVASAPGQVQRSLRHRVGRADPHARP